MQRVVEVGHGAVGAVDGEGVLNQVVGADRKKIEPAQERPEHQRRRGNFDHGADRDRLVELVP